MGRMCSRCGKIGHNSRTCTTYKGNINVSTTSTIGLRLFGVQLVDLSSACSSSSAISQTFDMKKSFSMECVSPTSPSSSSSLVSINEISDKTCIGYLSDNLLARARERKKGVPWTAKEHGAFLIGLQKLGKGDWRGISRNFVITRTPTQVASHAQKYSLRQATLVKKKRRSSLFDMGNCSINRKQSCLAADNYFGTSSSFDQVDENNNLPPVGLNVSVKQHHIETSDQETNYPPPAVSHHHDHSISIWSHGSENSKAKSTTATPDLELKLAAPELTTIINPQRIIAN